MNKIVLIAVFSLVTLSGAFNNALAFDGAGACICPTCPVGEECYGYNPPEGGTKCGCRAKAVADLLKPKKLAPTKIVKPSR